MSALVEDKQKILIALYMCLKNLKRRLNHERVTRSSVAASLTI